MPTSKQRRENARRRLERQIQRRQEAAAKRRRRNVVAAAALSVLLVVGAVWLILTQVGGEDTPAAAAPSESATPTAEPTTPAPTPSREPKATNGACKYTETAQTLTNPNAKDVGLPPDPKTAPAKGTVPVTLTTTQGRIVITLDRASAPCAVQSFLFLAEKKFFDNSPCPRVASRSAGGLGILQCGDPSGTTSGGPTYQFKEENLSKADYSVGVVAMANGGPGTTGSQFFLIHEDARTLPKNYSVIGKITTGLDVVQKVARAGNDGSNQAGGGKPNLPITIQTIRTAA